MERPSVWFNKSLSGTWNIIEIIRAAEAEFGTPPLRILCSHTHPDFAALRLADVAEVEPRYLSESAYLDFCLDFVRRNRVDVFVPGKNLRSLARHRQLFADLGCRLIVAGEAATLKLLENKAALYSSLPPELVPLPEFRVVNDLPGFDRAFEELRSRHRQVCIKPAVSLFGLGFKIIVEGGRAIDRLLAGEAFKIGLAELRQCLGEVKSFRDLLVMEYLPGHERSVDCLASQGHLLRWVVRKKPLAEGGQTVEDNPAIAGHVSRLTAHLRLDGLFNVQFRDREDSPLLLEINPRMSGGIHYACLSGFAFPYWAIRLALGTAQPDHLPRPQTGFRVTHVDRAVRL